MLDNRERSNRHLVTFVVVAMLCACGDPGESAGTADAASAALPSSEMAADATVGMQAVADAQAAREAMPGKAIYDQWCASCHDGAVKKAPHKLMVGLMTPEAILGTLRTGLMAEQGAVLSADEQVLVAEYLAGVQMGQATQAVTACADGASPFDAGKPPQLQGWGFDLRNTHSVPAAVTGLNPDNVADLQLKWAFAFPGANRARSQPAVAGGAIHVGSHNGVVYALDQNTGCARWQFESAAEVRTGIVIESWAPDDADPRPRAYFGDVLGNVYAIDARSGEGLWRVRVDEHPNATITGTPALYDGRLFVPVSSLEVSLAADPTYECCTGRGAVVALDAASGEMIWKTFTISEKPTVQSQNRAETNMYGPSGAMVWNTPSIDAQRNQLYIGTGENMSSPATLTSDAIMAMDLDTGRIKWSFQATPNDAWNTACDTDRPDSCPEENGPDFDFGASTMLIRTPGAGDLVIGGQKSGNVFALSADDGRVVWKQRVGRGGIQGGVHFGMAADGARLYVPISDMADGRAYDTPARPGVHALDPETGDILWSAINPEGCAGRDFCHPGVSQAISAARGMVIAGAMDGMLRIHDGASGKVLWQTDTTQPVTALGGARAVGGSFGGGAAPVLDGNQMIVSSGYGLYLHMPGNLLMVYEIADES